MVQSTVSALRNEGKRLSPERKGSRNSTTRTENDEAREMGSEVFPRQVPIPALLPVIPYIPSPSSSREGLHHQVLPSPNPKIRTQRHESIQDASGDYQRIDDTTEVRSNSMSLTPGHDKGAKSYPSESIAHEQLVVPSRKNNVQEQTPFDKGSNSNIQLNHLLENHTDRIVRIATKLSDVGLLPIQAHRCMAQMQLGPVPEHHASHDQHIIYSLQLCKSQGSTFSHSLLTMIEAIVDETVHMSQECEKLQGKLWENKSQVITGQPPTQFFPSGSHSNCHSKSDVPMPSTRDDSCLRSNDPSFRASNNSDQEARFQQQHQYTALRIENDSMRAELRLLIKQRHDLEDLLNKAICGDRSSVQKEVELFRAHERKDMQELQRREIQLHSALAAKESETKHFQDIVHRMQMEIDSMIHVHQTRENLLHQLEKESQIVKRDGQSLAVENATLHSEVQSLRNRLDEEIRRADSSVHIAQTCELTKNELAMDKRRLHEQLSYLESEVEKLRLEQVKSKQEFSSCQDENRRQKGQLQNLGVDIQRRVTELASLERQRDEVIRNSETLKRSLRSAETEIERIRKELKSLTQAVEEKNQEVIEMQRILMTSQKNDEFFRSSLSELHRERDVLQTLLEKERYRTHELEELLSCAKAKENVASEQIKALLREKASLSTRLNEAHSRLHYASNRYCTSDTMNRPIRQTQIQDVDEQKNVIDSKLKSPKTNAISKNNLSLCSQEEFSSQPSGNSLFNTDATRSGDRKPVEVGNLIDYLNDINSERNL